MSRHVTIEDAAQNLADCIARVVREQAVTLLTDDGRPVAELAPAPPVRTLAELPALLKSLPELTREELEEFAADLRSLQTESSRSTAAPTWD